MKQPKNVRLMKDAKRACTYHVNIDHMGVTKSSFTDQ